MEGRFSDEVHRGKLGRDSELPPTTGTDVDGRVRVRGSPAKRLSDYLGPPGDDAVDAGE